jgi:hypothetical protein
MDELFDTLKFIPSPRGRVKIFDFGEGESKTEKESIHF